MASGGRRRLVPCFLGILLNALIGKLHYVISRVIGNALLINNPELGSSPVSVSAPAVNTNVETNAGAKCTAESGAYLGVTEATWSTSYLQNCP